MKRLVFAIAKIDLIDLGDRLTCRGGKADRLCRRDSGSRHDRRLVSGGGGRGFRSQNWFHGRHGVYHLWRLRSLLRRKMDAAATIATTARKTNAVPYWTRSVYSFCGIFELTT